MIITPLPQDSTEAVTSVRTLTGVPDAPPVGLERHMLQQDKLYVVMAVVLLIWLGVAFYLFRTDRRIAHLEKLAEPAEPTSRS